MSRELIVRPGLNDHVVIADLIAPGGSGVMLPQRRPIIGRLVVDAQHVPQRPQFAEAAASAGVPFLIDPLTFLLQGELRAEDMWAQLPFGRSVVIRPIDFGEAEERRRLVAQVVAFQIDHGATAIIPPYPYVEAPEDPWFAHALDFIRLTSAFMESHAIRLPILPVFCAGRRAFGAEQSWEVGIDHLVSTAFTVGADAVAFCLSPVGDGNDSYHKVFSLFSTAERISQAGMPVIAWRQGMYGPGLVAAGAIGYETGIATREKTDIRSTLGNRKPPKPGKKSGGGGFAGVYLPTLNRSLSSPMAKALLDHPGFAAKVLCDDERCCPNGSDSTIEAHREHAVRSRAKGLAAISDLPQRAWRLHHIVNESEAAMTLALQANGILEAAGIKERIHLKGMESLAQVAEHLRQAPPAHQVA